MFCHAAMRACRCSFRLATALPRRTARAMSATAVFDKSVTAAHRAASAKDPVGSRDFDYLRDEVAARLVDRLNDITREFPVALDLGANTGNIVKQLSGHGGVKKLFMLDSCRERLFRDEADWKSREDLEVVPLVANEEGRLPFDDASLDLVLSSMSLHWWNDLPGVLAEVRRVLKPDGVFLAALVGGESLMELRSAFVAAQTDREGGVSPHVSPMAGVSDVGNLLAAAGFGIPTVDSDQIRVEYPTALRLAEHLQGMGDGNASLQRKLGGRRDTLLAMAAVYQTLYTPAAVEAAQERRAAAEARAPAPSGEAEGSSGGDGTDAAGAPAVSSPLFSDSEVLLPTREVVSEEEGITANFEIVYMIGWAPARSQPKPLRRGSVPKGFAARGEGPPQVEGASPAAAPTEDTAALR